MSLDIRKILVAVTDGAATRVADRTAQIAKASNAQVELFSVVRPVPPVLGMTRVDDAQITRAWIDAKRQELEKLAKRLRLDGIAVTCTVAADYSITDAIVRRALYSKADLVTIEAHKHNVLARVFLNQTDYDLIRECPVPLLIVKGKPSKPKAPVLAAIDPWHARGKPAGMDDRVIEAGSSLAQALGGILHSGHAFSPLIGFISDSTFSPAAIPVSMPEEKKYTASVRKHFRAVNAKYGISPRHAHLQLGDPAFVLPDMARTLKAQLLVMGAISRSAVQRILIGNTAERVLDALPCDILIVKPRGFRTSVK